MLPDARSGSSPDMNPSLPRHWPRAGVFRTEFADPSEGISVKSFLLLLAGFVVGGIAAVMLAGPVATGVGAGFGVATGLQAGACLTVEAAKEKGLITAEQVGEVLQAAAQLIADTNVPESPGTDSGAPMSDADCQAVVARLKAAGEK